MVFSWGRVIWQCVEKKLLTSQLLGKRTPPEDGSSTFLRNTGIHPAKYALLHPRSSKFCSALPALTATSLSAYDVVRMPAGLLLNIERGGISKKKKNWLWPNGGTTEAFACRNTLLGHSPWTGPPRCCRSELLFKRDNINIRTTQSCASAFSQAPSTQTSYFWNPASSEV